MNRAPPYVVVGRIAGPHGVRGLLRLAPDTDFPERLLGMREAVLIQGGRSTPVQLAAIRPHGAQWLVQIEGIDSREAAEAWRGAELGVPRKRAAALPPDRHYVFEVIGLRVETESGEALGTVIEILRTGSNDVYVVKTDAREILIPAISSVVLAIEPARGRIVIRPLPGMLD